ncbi:MAG: Hpt domain-containing protein [Gammaproteobacteria bacterium]|nr:Hpt domain-containing protein [Gammaproteobacteria bacterium]
MTIPDERQEEVTEYAILGDDADEEIVEIFIEEAIEVLGELHNYLPKWKLDHNDEESLAVLRRSFHTLKGSGRLLGANLIGEFSWKFENLLNRIIDNKISVSEPLLYAIDEALAVLPQLIEQLKGNREPVDNISQLMAAADTLAEGGSVSIEPGAGKQEISAESLAGESSRLAETGSNEFDDISTADSVEDVSVFDSPVSIADDVHEADKYADDVDVIAVDLDEPELDEPELDEPELDEPEEGDEVITIEKTDELIIEDLSIDDLGEQEISIIELPDESESDEQLMAVDSLEIEDDEFDIELTSDRSEQDESLANAVVDEASDDVEFIDISEDDEYSIEIDEFGYDAENSEGQLDLDPVLLKIYVEESQSHLKAIRDLLDDCDVNNQSLQAGKTLIRAFHTLYGSARTAEVEAISEICGATEKYLKARQEGADVNIPGEVSAVLREIEQAVSVMLLSVENGLMPVHNKKIQEKINKILQKEIQSQLQRSWHDNLQPDYVSSSLVSDADIDSHEVVDTQAEEKSNVISIDMSELDPDAYDDDIEDYTVAAEEVETPEPVSEIQEIVTEEAVVMSYGDIDAELIDIFLEEADELLESCEDTLREIINTPNSTEHIHQLQRNMHTLKGGARMADLVPVGDLTHSLESLVVMVAETKVNADRVLFDLLQESLDVLTSMLNSVRKRESIVTANSLNKRIEMLMRGEIEEKRSVERFDVEPGELDSIDDDGLEEFEGIEDVDISELLRTDQDDSDEEKITIEELPQDDNEKTLDQDKEKPHWGERATDVNFKESQEQVRVRSDLLNNLVNYAGEVNIHHARMGKQISDIGYNLSELNQTVIRLKEQLRKLEIETEIQIRSGYEKESNNFDDSFDPLEMDQYSTMQQLTRSLGETASDVESINEILSEITRDSETLLIQESRISTDLQEGLMRTRMVRFGGLSSRLRRIVRQISRELGKEVDIEILGENCEVDRTVLDRIIAPLEHMLRNAVAHGIEQPEVRKAMDKNETGKISIEVNRQGASVVITVKDDGAGINVDKVRAKAIRQGYITESSNLSDHDTLQFILQSGFSTADEVSQVAGRGVGMDVVDSEIKQLGGVLEIDTTHGKGTEFNIRLPLTLAINQALLVNVADDVFAVPLASIEGVVRITGLELQRFYDSENSHYEFNGIDYELKHLGGLLTGRQSDYSKQMQLFPVLLINIGAQHFALHVDDLLGRREIVVKPVGLQIGGVRGIAGATILADGRVVLILEMSALVVADSLFKAHTPVAEVAEPVVIRDKTTIMVVDDSITIRKVTERMLLRYGIEVILAKDGVDATGQLQEMVPDLMLLDIEMPRMDGFEVASFVRSDERLKNLPIIMITSRTGSKHKEKAMEIGVDRYLGKPFQEDDLVNNINEILNTSFSTRS